MHVIIRQLSRTPDVPPKKVKLELVVVDTGKVGLNYELKWSNFDSKDDQGISQDFLKARAQLI